MVQGFREGLLDRGVEAPEIGDLSSVGEAAEGDFTASSAASGVLVLFLSSAPAAT